MTDTDLARFLDVGTSIALEAGRLTLATYRQELQIDVKRTDVDLVTQTDLASEELIRQRLKQHFPDHAVLAEEGGASDNEGSSSALWIVDPLDGTTNFAHGHPFYCVSMALQIDGALVVGIIHAPVLGWTWTARLGGGAWRNKAPITVSKAPTLDVALCASGFPYDRRTSDDNNTAEWAAVIRHAQGVRRCGSAAIDLAFIADGTFDGYWEKRLKPWDLAAGALLVTEAGGRVTSIDGEDVPPWPEVIVATNGSFHERLMEVVRGG